jgi:hypothetical protein
MPPCLSASCAPSSHSQAQPHRLHSLQSRPDAPDGIPKRWAEQHPGQVRSFKPSEFPHKTLQV